MPTMSGCQWMTGILLVFALAAVSCSQEVQQRDTVIVDGHLYEIGQDHPFTGTVVGRAREGYRSESCVFKKEFKDGLQDGETEFTYPNGKLESKVPYKRGKINGFVIRYWPNGKPKARIHFADGLRGGFKGEMFWDESGRQIKG
jgi:MORN repeat variant